jgi:hypothetical protein
MDGSALSNISQISISIEAGNSHLIVDSAFILDSSRSRLIRYFGCNYEIMISFNIEILCSSCFVNCESLSFESSSLSRIESTAFAGTCVHFASLPEGVVFIAEDAFPRSCENRISNIDSCKEFNEWKEARQSGSTEAFERRMRNENDKAEQGKSGKGRRKEKSKRKGRQQRRNQGKQRKTKNNRLPKGKEHEVAKRREERIDRNQ